MIDVEEERYKASTGAITFCTIAVFKILKMFLLSCFKYVKGIVSRICF